ncbi:MAG: hypothetical protein MJ252_05595 [archaeon]|nr:hypothetical protein [archaeon]
MEKKLLLLLEKNFEMDPLLNFQSKDRNMKYLNEFRRNSKPYIMICLIYLIYISMLSFKENAHFSTVIVALLMLGMIICYLAPHEQLSKREENIIFTLIQVTQIIHLYKSSNLTYLKICRFSLLFFFTQILFNLSVSLSYTFIFIYEIILFTKISATGEILFIEFWRILIYLLTIFELEKIRKKIWAEFSYTDTINKFLEKSVNNGGFLFILTKKMQIELKTKNSQVLLDNCLDLNLVELPEVLSNKSNLNAIGEEVGDIPMPKRKIDYSDDNNIYKFIFDKEIFDIYWERALNRKVTQWFSMPVIMKNIVEDGELEKLRTSNNNFLHSRSNGVKWFAVTICYLFSNGINDRICIRLTPAYTENFFHFFQEYFSQSIDYHISFISDIDKIWGQIKDESSLIQAVKIRMERKSSSPNIEIKIQKGNSPQNNGKEINNKKKGHNFNKQKTIFDRTTRHRKNEEFGRYGEEESNCSNEEEIRERDISPVPTPTPSTFKSNGERSLGRNESKLIPFDIPKTPESPTKKPNILPLKTMKPNVGKSNNILGLPGKGAIPRPGEQNNNTNCFTGYLNARPLSSNRLADINTPRGISHKEHQPKEQDGQLDSKIREYFNNGLWYYLRYQSFIIQDLHWSFQTLFNYHLCYYENELQIVNLHNLIAYISDFLFIPAQENNCVIEFKFNANSGSESSQDKNKDCDFILKINYIYFYISLLNILLYVIYNLEKSPKEKVVQVIMEQVNMHNYKDIGLDDAQRENDDPDKIFIKISMTAYLKNSNKEEAEKVPINIGEVKDIIDSLNEGFRLNFAIKSSAKIPVGLLITWIILRVIYRNGLLFAGENEKITGVYYFVIGHPISYQPKVRNKKVTKVVKVGKSKQEKEKRCYYNGNSKISSLFYQKIITERNKEHGLPIKEFFYVISSPDKSTDTFEQNFNDKLLKLKEKEPSVGNKNHTRATTTYQNLDSLRKDKPKATESNKMLRRKIREYTKKGSKLGEKTFKKFLVKQEKSEKQNTPNYENLNKIFAFKEDPDDLCCRTPKQCSMFNSNTLTAIANNYPKKPGSPDISLRRRRSYVAPNEIKEEKVSPKPDQDSFDHLLGNKGSGIIQVKKLNSETVLPTQKDFKLQLPLPQSSQSNLRYSGNFSNFLGNNLRVGKSEGFEDLNQLSLRSTSNKGEQQSSVDKVDEEGSFSPSKEESSKRRQSNFSEMANKFIYDGRTSKKKKTLVITFNNEDNTVADKDPSRKISSKLLEGDDVSYEEMEKEKTTTTRSMKLIRDAEHKDFIEDIFCHKESKEEEDKKESSQLSPRKEEEAKVKAQETPELGLHSNEEPIEDILPVKLKKKDSISQLNNFSFTFINATQSPDTKANLDILPNIGGKKLKRKKSKNPEEDNQKELNEENKIKSPEVKRISKFALAAEESKKAFKENNFNLPKESEKSVSSQNLSKGKEYSLSSTSLQKVLSNSLKIPESKIKPSSQESPKRTSNASGSNSYFSFANNSPGKSPFAKTKNILNIENLENESNEEEEAEVKFSEGCSSVDSPIAHPKNQIGFKINNFDLVKQLDENNNENKENNINYRDSCFSFKPINNEEEEENKESPKEKVSPKKVSLFKNTSSKDNTPQKEEDDEYNSSFSYDEETLDKIENLDMDYFRSKQMKRDKIKALKECTSLLKGPFINTSKEINFLPEDNNSIKKSSFKLSPVIKEVSKNIILYFQDNKYNYMPSKHFLSLKNKILVYNEDLLFDFKIIKTPEDCFKYIKKKQNRGKYFENIFIETNRWIEFKEEIIKEKEQSGSKYYLILTNANMIDQNALGVFKEVFPSIALPQNSFKLRKIFKAEPPEEDY